MRNDWQTQSTDTNDKRGQQRKLIASSTAATESNDSPATHNGAASIVGVCVTGKPHNSVVVALHWLPFPIEETLLGFHLEIMKLERCKRKSLHRSWLVIRDSQPPHKAHSVLLLTAPARRSLVLSSIHTVPSLPPLPPFPPFSLSPLSATRLHPAPPSQSLATTRFAFHQAPRCEGRRRRYYLFLWPWPSLEIGHVTDAASATNLKAYQTSSITHATGSVPQLLAGLIQLLRINQSGSQQGATTRRFDINWRSQFT